MTTSSIEITIPKAFSVRDEHELLAFRHLMQRLNPLLCVTEIAQGIHRDGGQTKFWGLVHEVGQKMSKEQILKFVRSRI